MTQVSCEVGAALEDQAAKVAAQAGAGADIAVRADDDVADQDRRGMDVGGRVDHGRDAIDGIDFKFGFGHALSPVLCYI